VKLVSVHTSVYSCLPTVIDSGIFLLSNCHSMVSSNLYHMEEGTQEMRFLFTNWCVSGDDELAM
jgi:hypothetical protein